ncbi:MAG TPA: YhdP family protein [Thiobacillaceae bacterium]|nr:YhdP family protein [Thiobacillaceae bacterium]
MPILTRLLRWSGVALLAAMAMGGGLLAYLYLWVLPHIADYRGTLEDLLSSATGFQVSVAEVGGEWGGTRPWFTLKGVTLRDRDNRPVLHFDRLDGRFGWRSVLTLEPRFHSLKVQGSALVLRRTMDGKYRLGGIAIDPQSPNHAFSDWLLKQGELSVAGLTLAWIDDFRHAPPLVLTGVSLDLNNLGRRHGFQVFATAPERVGGTVELYGTLHGRGLSRLNEWYGNLHGLFRNLRLDSLAAWSDLPYLKAGRGGVALTGRMDKGQIVALDARLNMLEVDAQVDPQHAPLHLRRLVGEVGWESKAGAHWVRLGGLSLQPAAGAVIGPLNGQASWARDGSFQLAVDELQLTSLRPLLASLPIKPALQDRLIALQAQGRIDHLQASWRPAARPGERATFSVNGRFRQLGWEALDQWPGVKGLNGSLAGNQDKGEFSVEVRPGQLDLPQVFRDRKIEWTRLLAQGGWRWQSAGYELQLANVVLENADLAGTVAGTYRIGRNGPDHVDLSGRLERALGASVYRYLPRTVHDEAYAWLKQAIPAGLARQASFTLRGDPRRFPFRNNVGGLFQIDALADGVTLRYARDWPKIDAIDGELRFRNERLEILSDQARIFGTQLHRVQAVIPDLSAAEQILDVKGEATGPLAEFVRFANFSPVSDQIDNLTEDMSGTGDLSLGLNIKVPLGHPADTTVAGRLGFNNNTVYPAPDVPRLEQVNGHLDFTDRTVSANRVSARALGGPALFAVTTQDSRARVLGQGVFTAAALETWLGKPVSRLLSGQASWKGEMLLGHGTHASIKAESNLVGLESGLPAPLGKRAGQAVQMTFQQQPLKDGTTWSSLNYAKQVSGLWVSRPTARGMKVDRGEIRFGEQAQLPQQAGVSVAGYVRDFDLGGWLDLVPVGEEQQTPLNAINLTLSNLNFLGRRFADVNINGKLVRGGIFKFDVAGQGVQGSVAYRRASAGAVSRVSGVFSQLVIPAPLSPGAKLEGPRLVAADFPSLDVSVDDLRMQDLALGRLEAQAHGSSAGLVIDQMRLTSPDSVVSMSGLWNDAGKGDTSVKLETEIKDAGKMLARYGFPDMVKRGKGSVSGDVSWQGSPADFAFRTLTGTLNFTAQSGQFLKAEPGVAKLLGVVSLQSIPRRMNLDFRDVFTGGFAFDQISATLRIVGGNVYSDDFRMKGPAATVKMSGVARLSDETVQLRVKVSPKLSESVAVAGALLGGPLAGLGALAVQKVLKDPIEEATSHEILVNGPWAEPNVTKLPRLKTGKEPDRTNDYTAP